MNRRTSARSAPRADTPSARVPNSRGQPSARHVAHGADGQSRSHESGPAYRARSRRPGESIPRSGARLGDNGACAVSSGRSPVFWPRRRRSRRAAPADRAARAAPAGVDRRRTPDAPSRGPTSPRRAARPRTGGSPRLHAATPDGRRPRTVTWPRSPPTAVAGRHPGRRARRHGGRRDRVRPREGVLPVRAAVGDEPPSTRRASAWPSADKRVPPEYDPKVQHIFTDWLEPCSPTGRPRSRWRRPGRCPASTGTCFSVESISASLTPPVDVGHLLLRRRRPAHRGPGRLRHADAGRRGRRRPRRRVDAARPGGGRRAAGHGAPRHRRPRPSRRRQRVPAPAWSHDPGDRDGDVRGAIT